MEDDNFEAMSDQEIMAMMADEPGQGAPMEADPSQMDQPPQDMNPAPVPPSAPAEPMPEQAMPNPQMVPLGALHEERQRRQQMQSLLEDPNQLAALLRERHGLDVQAPQQAAPPELLVEDQAAIEAIVQQAVAPYAQEIEYLRAERQQTQAMRQMEEAKKAFGDDTEAMIAHFDQIMPQLRNADPFVKAAAVNGARWADPEYQKQQIEAKAKELATQQLTEALKSGGKQTPVTLAGVTPAESNGRSLDDMSDADVAKLSDADLERYLKSAYGDA